MSFVSCILISVPVVVCPKKVQIGPKRCKKSLTDVIAKHCSGIRESDISTIYSIRKVGCERCVGSSEIVVAANQLICARSIP